LEAVPERECNARKRMGKQLASMILAQIYNLSGHLETGICPRNNEEVYDLIESNRLKETLDK
jgi:hypothetical protein